MDFIVKDMAKFVILHYFSLLWAGFWAVNAAQAP
jgi:hypothetical protein